MRNYKKEYIIQHRVQDYWLDYVGDTTGGIYWYLDRAQDALEKLNKTKPNTDFRLVRREHTFTDEEI